MKLYEYAKALLCMKQTLRPCESARGRLSAAGNECLYSLNYITIYECREILFSGQSLSNAASIKNGSRAPEPPCLQENDYALCNNSQDRSSAGLGRLPEPAGVMYRFEKE
jgi:hypothetical protein